MPDDSARPAKPQGANVRTKSQRQLTTARMFVYRLAVLLGAFILEVLWWTSRKKFIGLERLEALLQEQGAVVPVFWHQHLLMCARFMCSWDTRTDDIAALVQDIRKSVEA